jgi:EAL domain-containing protein (putative c-di-GMP-specific phosphodiesterase class I)
MIEPIAPKILVLDDDLFMLKLLCDNGRSALEWVNHPVSPPDLILCDLKMPDMDGIEFTRKLVDHRYSGSLILMSGEDIRVLKTAEKLARAHRITVLGRLEKPVTPEALAAMVKKWKPPSKDMQRAGRKVYSSAELSAAIANGELINFYQPKVDVSTYRIVGMEALVRWQHPVDGLVFPDQFISVAEANDLIDDLTRVVLIMALTQAKVWQNAGQPLRVAVNVSMDSLQSLGFADFVAGLATEAAVLPQEVVLEVTETRLMGDIRAPLETLTRLRLKRFHLSIDDFGTGHSSLAQLRDIPFDELKIDQSFVHGAWADETLRAIYNASLGLANQLGIEIVAEGVEDREDWDFLRQTGCHLAQGYHIARPMPAGDLPGWIETWNNQHKAPDRLIH